MPQERRKARIFDPRRKAAALPICRKQTIEEAVREAEARKGQPLAEEEVRIVRVQAETQPRVICEAGALGATRVREVRGCEVWVDPKKRRWELVSVHGTIATGKLVRGRLPKRVRVQARKAGCRKPAIVETRL